MPNVKKGGPVPASQCTELTPANLSPIVDALVQWESSLEHCAAKMADWGFRPSLALMHDWNQTAHRVLAVERAMMAIDPGLDPDVHAERVREACALNGIKPPRKNYPFAGDLVPMVTAEESVLAAFLELWQLLQCTRGRAGGCGQRVGGFWVQPGDVRNILSVVRRVLPVLRAAVRNKGTETQGVFVSPYTLEQPHWLQNGDLKIKVGSSQFELLEFMQGKAEAWTEEAIKLFEGDNNRFHKTKTDLNQFLARKGVHFHFVAERCGKLKIIPVLYRKPDGSKVQRKSRKPKCKSRSN